MRSSVVLFTRSAIATFGLMLGAGTPLGAQEPQGVEKLGMAESVIGREEAAAGRAFEPSFRAKAKKLLAALPLAEITSQTEEGGLGLNSLGDSQADLVYTPVTPCRIIDTRRAGGLIAPGAPRSFLVTGTDYSDQGGSAAGCGVPFGPTTAAVVNFVAVNPGGAGNLRVTPFGTAMPLASIINFSAGMNLANGLVVATCNPFSFTCSSDITIQADVSATQLVADVQGYFQRTPQLLVYTPLANTLLGADALGKNTTGHDNTATGSSALASNTTGEYNTATGAEALRSSTTGADNSAFGYQALANNTTGSYNSAVGVGALASNTIGQQNSAVGFQALNSNTTGQQNSAFGYSALAQNTTGWHNSAFGNLALNSNTTGNANIAVGYGAGNGLSSGDYNIYIGNLGTASESGVIRIGTVSTHTATYVAGISGATSPGGVPVYVDGSGKLGTTTSSRRYKEQIGDMGTESDVLMKLRPVSFYYRPELDETHLRQYGLVAEEVAEVAPGLVVYDKDGTPQTVRYHFVNAMLLNEVQKQRKLVEEQQTTIQELKARLAKLEAVRGRDR
jgi:hypothetical protein